MANAKEFEPEDPMMLQGVALPGDSEAAMAETFVEELIRMGFPDSAVLKVFSNPFYSGPHRLLTKHGEGFVRELIASIRGRWGHPRFSTSDSEVEHA